MTGDRNSIGSQLSEYDRTVIVAVMETVENVAVRISQRAVLSGELIDAAARLRTVLIWQQVPD